MTSQTLIRVAGWVLLVAVAFVTLAPIDLRPSLLPPNIERFGAFLVVGTLFAAGYRRRLGWVAAVLMGSAALLEVLQMLSPTRHGQVLDAGWKIAGAVCGLALGWLLTSRVRR